MKLEHGVRYRAEISLGFFEGIASNAQVESKLREAGFVDVDVWGEGRHRAGTGTWSGSSQDVEIPAQITKVERLP